jgi:hypothetical protein
MLIALMLTTIDVFAAFKRTFFYLKSVYAREQPFAITALWHAAASGREDPATSDHHLAKYSSVIADEPEEYHALHSPSDDESREEGQWANHRQGSTDDTVYDPQSPTRRGSEDTLHDISAHGPHSPRKSPCSRVQRIGQALFAVVERILVFAAFGQVIEGVVIYTGGCRANYLNSCLAHLIS